MPKQECPYFKEFATRCSFTGSQITSLDNPVIMSYCYDRFKTCSKFQRYQKEEKGKAEAQKVDKDKKKKASPEGKLADAFDKEIF